MKALEFLKKNQVLFQELIDAYSDSGDYDGDYDYESAVETLKELNEAIVELEDKNTTIGDLFIQIDALSTVYFCNKCGHSGKCTIEKAWNELSFNNGECDDSNHFGLPFACNKGKDK